MLLATTHAAQNRLAWFEQTASRRSRLFLESGALWSALAVVALALATAVTWTQVPLVSSTTSWTTPVDLGWGVRSSLFSFGTLTLFVVALCGVRMLAARHWSIRWRGVAYVHRPMILRARTLLSMGAAATAISLLYLFQFVFVDFARVATQAKQESESLLVRHHLNYTLPAQSIRMTSFHDGTANMGDRLLLLAQIVSPGLLLPILAGLLCFYGAYLLRRRDDPEARSLPSSWLDERIASQPRRRNQAIACWIALGALAMLALGRAPAALLLERFGQQALQEGTYHSAARDFNWALGLNPALTELPSFHQELGQAIYVQHGAPDMDTQLYLAEQDRQTGALDQAWLVDSLLYQMYPHDTFVVREIALTAEMQMERSLAGVVLPTNPETAQQSTRFAMLSLGAPLMWSNRLLAIQPNNLAGRYVRGRLLFTLQEYEAAATNFETILDVSSDSDMQSAAYTYLAFCHGALGDFAGERVLLRKAINLDHGYNNTTAREAASGLQ